MAAGQAVLFSRSVGNQATVEEEGTDYARVVADQMRALRGRAGLTSEAMAAALSGELGRRVHPPSLSRWERGHQMPKSDVLLAAMRIAGLALPSEAPADPRHVLEQELAALRRQVEMMARRMKGSDATPLLPPAHRTAGKYLTVAQAAKRAGVTRETMYSWVRANRVRGYAWMGRTVVLPEDVDGQV